LSINDVLAEYERIREKNSIEQQRRLKEVMDNIPQFGETRGRLSDAQRKRIQSAFGEGDDLEPVIERLKEDERSLLRSAGYDSNYLDPIYTCPFCRDTGFVEGGGRCECFKKRVLEDKLCEARLSDNGVSFGQFDLGLFDDTPEDQGRSQKEIMSRIKQTSEAYADAFPGCQSIFLMSGSTGLGKTYTAKCVMRRVIERGYTAAYYTAYRLFSMFHQDRLGEDVDLSPLFEVPLLVIDDLGTEPMTHNVTKEYLFDLINERSGLHTLIVTNLPFDRIKDRYGDRIHSRLMDRVHSKKIIFRGKDIRY
jgi:DNA replication protein DnaC